MELAKGQYFIKCYKNLLAVVFLVVLTTVVYLNALHAPFLFDGIAKIVDNPDIRNLTELRSRLIYPQNSNYHVFERNDPVRPIAYLTFALNYHFSKLDPFFYHLINLCLHILVVCLIFSLTKKITAKVGLESWFVVSFLTAMLFAVHPINTEVVTYIYHRAESLAALFYFSSILLFINIFSAKNQKSIFFFYLLSLTCYVFACLSKQTAMTLPFVLLMINYFFYSDFSFKKIKFHYNAFYWVLFILFFIYRRYLGDFFSTKDHSQLSYFMYFLTQLSVICLYLKSLLFGVGISIDHFITPIASIYSQKLIASSFIYLFIFSAVLRTKNKVNRTLLIFSVFWFVAVISPTSSIVPLLHAMADRRVYLPSFGFYLALSVLIVYFWGKVQAFPLRRFVFIIVLFFYFAYLGGATMMRNRLYQNPQLLWEDALAKYPRQSGAYDRLGNFFYQSKEYDKAIVQYQKALSLDDHNGNYYQHLGNTYLAKGLSDKAFQAYEAALRVDPYLIEGRQNMGNVYLEKKQYQQAIEMYKLVLTYDLNFVEAYINMGCAYERQQQYQSAKDCYLRAIKIDNRIWAAHSNLALVYMKQEDYFAAVSEYKIALELNPESAENRLNLAQIYIRQGNYAAAILQYQQLIALNKYLFEAYNGLGVVYFAQQQYAAAKIAYDKALQLSPDDSRIHNNLGLLYYALGDRKLAVAAYEKAILLDSSFFKAHYNLGLLYESQQAFEKALSCFTVCQKLDPNFSGLLEKIAYLKHNLNAKR